MTKIVGALVLVGVVALAAVGVWMAVAKDAPGDERRSMPDIKLGTLMHVWYGFDQDTGESVGGVGSSHWDSTVVVQPMKGLYTSDDPDVIRWQLNQMLQAGITWVLISWAGPAVDNLPDNYTANGTHIGSHRAAKAVLKEIGDLPGQPLKAAVLVEPWPDEAVLFGAPLSMTDGEKSKIWQAIHDELYSPFQDIWLELNDKPLVATWMPMHIGEDVRFSYRLMNVYEDVPAPEGYLMDWNMLDTEDERVFELLLDNEDGFRKVSPRLNWRHLYMSGFRDEPRQHDPYFKDGWYESQWRWADNNREGIKLLLVWTWNEYHEQNFIEPTDTPPEIGVGTVYRDKTRHYFDRLRSGQSFKEYEGASVSVSELRQMIGSIDVKELGLPNDVELDLFHRYSTNAGSLVRWDYCSSAEVRREEDSRRICVAVRYGDRRGCSVVGDCARPSWGGGHVRT